MFSIYYIASESNQVCLWLPYVLNTTKSRLLILSHSAAGGVAVGLTWWRLLGYVPVLLLY